MNFPNNINTSNTFPNSQYGPFGVNDNNFNRKSMPSNIFPPNGGKSGDPMNQFNPISTTRQSLANFNTAFNGTDPIIENINYTNKRNVLHDNIRENVLDETIVEYRINLDSLDRNIEYFPDPFHFVVQFKPISKRSYNEDKYNDKFKGIKSDKNVTFVGTPAPYINREFRNVKYVKIESIILPQYTKIEYTEDHKPVFDESSNLLAERCVSLIINELDYDEVYTTADGSSRIDNEGNAYTPHTPFALIVPDKKIGVFYSGIPFYGSKIFKNSTLGNIKQLTIQFEDGIGLPIRFENLFTHRDLQNFEEKHGYPLPLRDIRHPLNKKVQVCISLLFGVVEAQINTNTKFEF